MKEKTKYHTTTDLYKLIAKLLIFSDIIKEAPKIKNNKFVLNEKIKRTDGRKEGK